MELSAAQAIEKYNIPLETPPMDKEELDKTPYILIRHGLSAFNYNMYGSTNAGDACNLIFTKDNEIQQKLYFKIDLFFIFFKFL